MSKYQCKCGGLILPDFDSFKLADAVNCMIETCKSIGNGQVIVRQKAFVGIITKIDGDKFTIEGNSKTHIFERGEFTPIKAPGPIEYFRIGKCRCELDKEQQA
ncbi:hypothetical protein ACFODO_13940 [Acinetobacter sichuanensis]|uniref:Uncharacterized protein n=1 Tax=Acinetobacter sichuanensis TaxID=2136183 RepID=A0A371YJV8_9GAMM|nr:hypothetical protein [Acinetobacter sichuanensis]RFC81769.1 hypothetical protein C9E89_020080 [Acinetobacter sichuanensis]